MAKKGENIYQRKDGRWEGKYKKSGSGEKLRYGYVTGASYDEVLRKKQAAVKAIGESLKQSIQLSDQLMFSSLAAEWLKEQEPLLKQTTVCKYRNNLNNHLIPEYGDRHVTEITRDEVDVFLRKLLISGGRDGRGLAANTAKSVLSVLKTVVEYARDRRHAVVADLGSFTVKEKKKPLRVLSVNEQHRLEEFLLADMDNDRLGILLCLYTGIRLGELCALKWKDISFGERELNIHATMARIQTPDNPAHRTEVVVTMPKSDCSVRNIPLPENIFRLLKEMEGPQDAYILTGYKDVFIEPRTMENHFKAVIEEAGIPDANFHALRHTFATRCVEIGFDVKTLSEILGHASVRITMDRYVHPTKAMKQRNMDNLSEMMAGR